MRCFVRSGIVLSATTIAIAALSSSAFAQVQSIVQTVTIPTQTVSYTQSLTINRFDSNLGNLVSVVIDLTTNITANVSVANINSGNGASFSDISGTIPVTVTGPSSTNVTSTATATQTFDPPQTINQGQILTYNGLTASSSNSQTITSGFGDYVGTGAQTVQLTATAPNSTASGTGTPGLFYGSNGTAGGTVRVTYNYVVTPEPSALGFLAVGVAPIGTMIIRRRRRAK